MQQPVAVQRAGILAELPSLLAQQGISPGAVFSASGIAPGTLTADTRVPFTGAVQCLEKAAELTGLPNLGLLLGLRFTLAHHGPLGQLMRCAGTLQQALLDFTSWQPGYSSGAIVYLHPMGDEFVLGYGAAGHGSPVLYDAILGVGLRMLDELTGGAVQPEEIHLPQRPPDSRTHYAQNVKAPIRFNQHRMCLVLPQRALAMPLPAASPQEHQRIVTQLRSLIQASRPEFAARTQQALRRALQSGDLSMAAVAAELAIHPRTLRRRLAEEQTSFEALCDTLRYGAAREYLALTDLPVSEISAALAYASPGVFAEAFRRWSGLSPTAWRRSQQEPASPA